MSFFHDIYQPQQSCGQGNIFTPVCHSFCSQGGGGLPQCILGYHHHHPRSRHHQPPWTRHPPGADTTPRTRHPPDQTPPGSRLQHMVYQWPVCILLECILVINIFQNSMIFPGFPGVLSFFQVFQVKWEPCPCNDQGFRTQKI